MDISFGYSRYFSKDSDYYGILGTAERDEFSDLNIRASVGPMVGSRFIHENNMNLDFAAGVVVTYEEESGINSSRTYPSLAWRLNFDRLILNDMFQFYHRHGLIWDLEHTDNVVIKSWTGLRGPSIWGIVTSLEAQTDWDSDPVAGSKEVDTVYRIKLGYQW